MTAPSWPRLKHRFAVSFSAEAAADSNRSITDGALDPARMASGLTKLPLGSAVRKEVVLVTGGAGFLGQGAGFLGQHVVRLLQERASNVEEIRVFDTRPYHNKLGKWHSILWLCAML